MKSQILKKSFIKKMFPIFFLRFFLKIFRKDYSKGKVLIKSCDGIGDILIRVAFVEKILEKYGRKNCYFLFPENYLELGEILDYNCIPFYGDNTLSSNNKAKKNFFLRFDRMLKLNRMGFSKYINLEYNGDMAVACLFMPDRVAREYNNNPYSRYCNKYYTKKIEMGPKGYILENVHKFAENILEEKIKFQDIIPDLSSKFVIGNEGISIGIGASAIERTCSPLKMCEYIEFIIEKYPEEKIYLLGVGSFQIEYAKEIVKRVKNNNIINLAGKTTMRESFERIALSKLFIGFDSGLYNLAFALKKKTIALFRKKNEIHFIHEAPWIEVLLPLEENIKINKNIKKDDLYNDLLINSITATQFRKALNRIE